ncbi:MAG: endonuclease III [Nevskia sp.]|nr:endonuclease III [Nevskia sp.]
MQRLRAVCGAVPGGLHRPAAAAGRIAGAGGAGRLLARAPCRPPAAPAAPGAGARRGAAGAPALAAGAGPGLRHRRRPRPRPRAPSRFPRPAVKPASIAELYRRLAALDPEPRSELAYSTPFELLCAVVLSAQATDVGVNKATARLYPVANTPQQILALGEAGLREYIRTIGLYQTKAKHLIRLAQLLLERHGGEVPRERAALEALPGVGRKTASVVLNVAFGEPAIAVDTHIFRVANRTGLAPGKTPDQVSARLEKITPAQYRLHAHHWLILHGRYVCKARRPECWRCPIADLCRYRPKTPAAGPAPAAGTLRGRPPARTRAARAQ